MYTPHIVGTNHLPYNIGATRRHIRFMRKPVKNIMLDKGVHIQGIKTNPSVFYGRLLNSLMRKYSVCFAYTAEDTVASKLEVEYEPIAGDLMEKLKAAAEHFNQNVNQIILQNVLDKRPDIIVIGNTHGKFLNDTIVGSTYKEVDNKFRGILWNMGLLAKGGIQYLKAKKAYKREYKNRK